MDTYRWRGGVCLLLAIFFLMLAFRFSKLESDRGLQEGPLKSSSSSSSSSSSGSTSGSSFSAPLQTFSKSISPPSPGLTQNNLQRQPIKKPEHQKLLLFREIIKSRNDNDPRIDREFAVLSSSEKEDLIGEYQRLPLEARNQRGLVVFILGRCIQSDRDFEFFKTVLTESPCLSLSHCEDAIQGVMGHSNQANSANLASLGDPNAVTLVYPQLMAIRMIRRYLLNYPRSRSALALLEYAQSSRSPLVAKAAGAAVGDTQSEAR